LAKLAKVEILVLDDWGFGTLIGGPVVTGGATVIPE
jgi:hypothetical protein